jgi:hypothetical protein
MLSDSSFNFFLMSFSKGLLGNSRFESDIPLIEKCFDQKTKLSFRNDNEPQFIRFGTTRDTDPSLGIRSGQLRLLGCISTSVGSTYYLLKETFPVLTSLRSLSLLFNVS